MARILEAPFDSIAPTYDDAFSNSPIGSAQRSAVWKEMDRVFQTGQRILEINCGTGIDAIHMAQRGVCVEACDSSARMIAIAEQRASAVAGHLPIRFHCLPTENIDDLRAESLYDGVLSNFSGLDCIADLRPVVKSLSRLVRPGGKAVVCTFGTFCLWEVFWYVSQGNIAKAFRRFNRQGVKAILTPSTQVTVHYRTVRSLTNLFAPYFRLERRHGVGIAVPPSYAAAFATKFPPLFDAAVGIDAVTGKLPIARSLADHTVLTFERTKEDAS
jgi:ubiquinone/menaquinone biosynthesis C-methylase UbiE